MPDEKAQDTTEEKAASSTPAETSTEAGKAAEEKVEAKTESPAAAQAESGKAAEAKTEEKAEDRAEAPAVAQAAAAAPATAPADAKPGAGDTEEIKAEEIAEVRAEVSAEVGQPDSAASTGQYYYPNKWARIVLTSAEEVMGKPGVNAMLNMAGLKQYIDNYPPDNMKKEFSFSGVGQLQQAIWDMYGNRGARVFAVRAGEESFRVGLQKFKGVADKAARVKTSSLEKKIKFGLGFFSMFFNTVSDQVVKIDEDDEYWYWIITRCPVCWGRKSEEPVCHLAIGVLQAALTWITDGKRFRVLETECKAKGDENCVIKIEKIPVE